MQTQVSPMTYALLVMKILISIGTLGLGGAEKQAVWLANRLSEHHDVTLLTYHGGVREKDLSPNVAWETIFEIEDHGQELDIYPGDSTDLEQPKSLQNSTSSAYEFIQVAFNKFFSKQALKQNARVLIRVLRVNKYLVSIVYKFTLNIINQSYVFRQARKKIKGVKPDLIITFLFHDTLNVGLASLLQVKRPRLIVGRRSPIGYGDSSRKLIHRLILRIIYKFSSLAISNSTGNLKSALHDGINKRKIKVIGNYVTKHRVSEIEYIQDEPLKIICIANFHWYKNHEGLLRAISIIPNHDKYFHFTFVGDGPLLNEIQRLAVDLRIAAEFKGFVENPSSEIHLFHAMALVSHVEGSSNALLEGLISGIPTLASMVGAAEELKAQGAALVLCDSSDTKSIANGLTQIKFNYESLRIQAKEFSQIISQTMNEEAILEQWEEAIQGVTSF
jgi:glycosyltransferase involved in cell wall biosynthesis